uniref:Uncharacterized protein n=1 Tax=Oryza brachyantha TaxID=4533 RepID=J3MW61_ORYBR
MGRKCRSPPSERKKNGQRKRWMPPLYTAARPPQQCWSITERVNFRIALGRPRVGQFVSTKSTDQICVYADYFQTRHTHSPVKKKGFLIDS